MIDAKSLLDRFLGSQGPGPQTPGRAPAPQPSASPWLNPGGTGGMAEAARKALGQTGGLGGAAVTGAAGGLLGMVLGGKKKGRSVLTHGGAALLGALASRAYENWQKGQAPAQAPVATPADPVPPRYLPAAAPASNGQPFELALIRAMIAAAKADGHVDAEEQSRIFAKVETLGLDAEGKAFVFDTLAKSPGVSEVAASAATPEQASELYLAARLAIDPDQPPERAWLEALAHRLKLPADLVAHLDRQADASLA